MMSGYPKERREWAIAQMLPPRSRAVPELAKESGISDVTLYNWRKQAGGGAAMKKGDAESWSGSQKLRVVIETAALSEGELSEYCRRKGLYVEQVKRWRAHCEQANEGAERGPERQARQEIKRLERELKRKEAALAEAAALLVLSKKAQAIWGEEKDA
jgi:transposase-like protein